jgi:DNA-binding NarL/FixJ family response regulator
VQSDVGIGARDLRDERAVDAGGRVSVMLAGEHPATLARVWSELEQGGFTVIAEVIDADEAINAAREFRPELCLLDIDLPGGGILAANQISLELPDTRIAVMFAATRHDQVRDAIVAGAEDHVPAATSPDRVTAALNGLSSGEAAPPRAVTTQLVRESGKLAPRIGNSRMGSAGLAFENQPLPPRSRVLYVPRLLRHYRRRRRSGMTIGSAWASARARMGDYC